MEGSYLLLFVGAVTTARQPSLPPCNARRGGCERRFNLFFYVMGAPFYREVFGKVKSLLRREKARTKGALVEAIGRALDAVTSEDAEGWFGHCGYALGGQLPR